MKLRQKNLPLPPQEIETFFRSFFQKIMDFNKNWIKSVQFRDNGDHIVLNLAKNRENTENYHANVHVTVFFIGGIPYLE